MGSFPTKVVEKEIGWYPTKEKYLKDKVF